MKFRTQNDVYEDIPTEFSTKTQLYKLDEVTGKLVEAGFQDDQALIQSYEDCALDKVLERFGFVPEEYMNPDLPQKWQPELGSYDYSQDMFPNDAANVTAQNDKRLSSIRSLVGVEDTVSLKHLKELTDKLVQDKIDAFIASQNKKEEDILNDVETQSKSQS